MTDQVGQGVSAVSEFVSGAATLGETLKHVAELAVEAVQPAEFAGLTMLVDGKPSTAVFTDERSPEIDSSQYETGIGPCLDSFRNSEVNIIVDTEKDDRWPPFSEACAARGIRSTLSMPLVTDNEGIGALNFYGLEPDSFSQVHVAQAQLFASLAAITLVNAQAYWDARQLSEHLNEAMKSRSVIEQAKGILMAGGAKSADEAFQMLVRVSQRENRKLREVAIELVERVQTREKSSGNSAPGPNGQR